ncbi:hypothetical protein V5O48_016594 [Marasmius crinis-equi]|uniref:Uncharacterized protein n=1 Tax=Marasmius crinis-equi TaxID=585013 RepID=A0ABR3ERB8_9AGAR
MNSLLKLVTVVSLFSLGVIAQEVTVNETDTKQITYGGGAGNASICKYTDNGTFIGGQAGCWNVQPQPPCTEFAAMGQENTSWASWKFKGSSLRITSLLSDFSPLFNVDIDGKTSEVDGAQIGKDSRAFTCFTLFSVDGLDGNVEHTVNLTVKGASPSRNTTNERDGRVLVGPLSLINYTYTESSNASSSSSSGNSSAGSGSSGSGSGNGNGSLVSASVSGVAALFAVFALYLGLN